MLLAEQKTDLIPKYLSYVMGVVDSNDLNINVARETLQNSKTFKVINQNKGKQSQKEDLDNYAKTTTTDYNISEEMEKLIMLYGGSKDKLELNREQFRELAQDLYQTLDSDRILSERELDNMIELVDVNGNGRISKDELIRMTTSNKEK